MAALIYTDSQGTELAVIFDAVTQEDFDNTAEVTSFPVERGANITDHVRPNRDRVAFSAAVSNTPVTPVIGSGDLFLNLGGQSNTITLGSTSRAGGNIPTLVGNNLPPRIHRAQVTEYPQRFDRIDRVYTELLLMLKNGTEFTYSSSRRVVNNLVLTNVSTSRTARQGTMAVFDLEAIQVLYAETQTAEIPQPAESETRANVAGDRGNQPAEETSGQNSQTLAARLADLF